MSTFRKFCYCWFICVIISQIVIEARLPKSALRVANDPCDFYIDRVNKTYTVNGVLIYTEKLCMNKLKLKCTVPWLKKYCPGYVMVEHCFDVASIIHLLLASYFDLEMTLEYKKRRPSLDRQQG